MVQGRVVEAARTLAIRQSKVALSAADAATSAAFCKARPASAQRSSFSWIWATASKEEKCRGSRASMFCRASSALSVEPSFSPQMLAMETRQAISASG